MSMWTQSLTSERQDQARQAYEVLSAKPWGDLSKSDQRVMMALGWFALETDAGPAEFLDEDLSEE